MTAAAQRGELAQIVYVSNYPDPTSNGIQPLHERARWEQDNHFGAAEAILTAGYRKPKVLGYVVVGRDGRMMRTSYETRETAEAVAAEWNADAKSGEVDWDYRVAEIVEAA